MWMIDEGSWTTGRLVILNGLDPQAAVVILDDARHYESDRIAQRLVQEHNKALAAVRAVVRP